MILYKIFRYICFLLLLLFIGMFFISDINNIPYISLLHTPIQQYYHNIPKSISSVNEVDKIAHNKRISQQILIEVDTIIDNFFKDISIDSALNAMILRQFDDLIYLMSEYLLQNEYFLDLIIYKDGKLVYKYNNNQLTNIITIRKERLLINGNLELLFLFKPNLIISQLDQIGELIYFSLNNKIYYSTRYADIGISVANQLNSYTGPLTEIITLENKQQFYTYSYKDKIVEPAVLFIPIPTSWNIANLMQFLFIIIIISIIILLIIIDNLVSKKLNLWVSQKNFEKKIHDVNADVDDLDWFDDFVRIEDEMNKENEHKNKN